jgi:hypothetical protein
VGVPQAQRVRGHRAYAGFWIGLGLYGMFLGSKSPNELNDLAWILLAFAIFNTYMVLWSLWANTAVFLVFLALEATLVILFLGFFADNDSIIKLGGWFGVVTAIGAWYVSAAGVINGMAGRCSRSGRR